MDCTGSDPTAFNNIYLGRPPNDNYNILAQAMQAQKQTLRMTNGGSLKKTKSSDQLPKCFGSDFVIRLDSCVRCSTS